MFWHRETSYPRILAAIQAHPWAVHESALADALEVLERRSAGYRLSDDEIATVIEAKGRDREAANPPKSIAVLNVFGLIVPRVERLKVSERGVSAEALDAVFRQAMDDPQFGAVVLNIDSPGGSVYGLTELAHTIRVYGRGDNGRRNKRVVAVINPYAASAAYYVAAQADEIVATPSGEGGSLGTFAAHADESEAAAKAGIKWTIVRSPADGFKAETLGIEPLTPEAKAHLQQRADEYTDLFQRDVAEGRGIPLSVVREEFGRGRVLGAQDMLKRKMVDRVDTFQNTLDRLSARLGRGIDVVSQDTAAAEDEGVQRRASTSTPPASAGRQEKKTMEPETETKAEEQKATAPPAAPDAPDLAALIQSAVAAAIGPAVSAAVDAAVKPVAERVTALTETSAADAKKARERGFQAKLDQLCQEGRLRPGDAKSELKMLLQVDDETAAERMDALSKRPRLPASMLRPIVDTSADTSASGLSIHNFSLCDPAILEANPDGAAETFAAVEAAGGEDAVKKNPRAYLAALSAQGPPDFMQRSR